MAGNETRHSEMDRKVHYLLEGARETDERLLRRRLDAWRTRVGRKSRSIVKDRTGKIGGVSGTPSPIWIACLTRCRLNRCGLSRTRRSGGPSLAAFFGRERSRRWFVATGGPNLRMQ